MAVVLSIETYRRLLSPAEDFWTAYRVFRASVTDDDLVDAPEVFADLRDHSPGREVSL